MWSCNSEGMIAEVVDQLIVEQTVLLNWNVAGRCSK